MKYICNLYGTTVLLGTNAAFAPPLLNDVNNTEPKSNEIFVFVKICKCKYDALRLLLELSRWYKYYTLGTGQACSSMSLFNSPEGIYNPVYQPIGHSKFSTLQFIAAYCQVVVKYPFHLGEAVVNRRICPTPPCRDWGLNPRACTYKSNTWTTEARHRDARNL